MDGHGRQKCDGCGKVKVLVTPTKCATCDPAAANSDFTQEDKGRYRHPDTIGGLPYHTLEAKFLAALEDAGENAGENVNADATETRGPVVYGVRTLPRIKQHMGLDKAFDLTQVVVGLELDKKISRHENGTITAFFRYDQRPRSMWLTGDGRVGAELDAEYRPSEQAEIREKNAASDASIELTPEIVTRVAKSERGAVEAAHDLGFSNVKAFQARLNLSPDLREIWETARKSGSVAAIDLSKNFSSFPTAGGDANSQTITPEQMEQLGREHGRLKSIATALDIGESQLYQILSGSSALQDAYTRGKVAWSKANRSKIDANGHVASHQTPQRETLRRSSLTSETQKPDKPKAERPGYSNGFQRKIDFTTERLEELAAEFGSKRRVSAELGYKQVNGLYTRLADDPAMQAAFHRGIARFKVSGKTTPHGRPPKTNNNEENTMTTAAAPALEKTNGRKSKLVIDAADLRGDAAKVGTMQKVADHFGAGLSTMSAKINSTPEMRSAFDEGQKLYTSEHGPIPKGGAPRSKGAAKPQRSSTRKTEKAAASAPQTAQPETVASPEDFAEKFEAAAQPEISEPENASEAIVAGESETHEEPSPDLKLLYLGDIKVDQHTSQPPADDLSEEKASREISKPHIDVRHHVDVRDRATGKLAPIDDFDELLSAPAPRKSVSAAEAVRNLANAIAGRSFPEAPAVSIDGLDANSSSLVKFSNGARLVLAFEGNVFDLSPQDRAVLDHITRIAQGEVRYNLASPTRWQRLKAAFRG